jgi:hypothetical protein
MFDVKEFIGSVDPKKLDRMYKAEISGDKKTYNKIKSELLEQFRKNKKND